MADMLRAAIYARFSTDMQRDASIEDQVRSCRKHATRQGLKVVEVYSDRAMSGASLMRSGIQKLLRDGRNGAFDVVLSEGLDRLSRNQADIAQVYQVLSFSEVTIETVTEGVISEMHIGLKGTMNALFLKDLAVKTHRGLKGRALAGKSAGGLTYGYRPVHEVDANGDVIRGDRMIEPNEAEIVRRIFRDYAKGVSPKKIAEALNLERIPGPQGGLWGASTIHGNRERGTGILNNELYIGRQIWNRLRYIKDPETGNRVSRPRKRLGRHRGPRTADHRRRSLGRRAPAAGRVEIEGHRDSGMGPAPSAHVVLRSDGMRLLRRRVLQGAEGSFGCSAARNKGKAVCTNRAVIKQKDLEARVLDALCHHLMDPEAVAVFCEAYTAERNRLAAAVTENRSKTERALAAVKRDHAKLVDAIIAGVPPEQVKDRMIALDARRKELEAELAAAEVAPAPIRLHPKMAETYRERVATLIRGLGADEGMEEAREALRGLIEKIVLVPRADGPGLTIDLHGALASRNPSAEAV